MCVLDLKGVVVKTPGISDKSTIFGGQECKSGRTVRSSPIYYFYYPRSQRYGICFCCEPLRQQCAKPKPNHRLSCICPNSHPFFQQAPWFPGAHRLFLQAGRPRLGISRLNQLAVAVVNHVLDDFGRPAFVVALLCNQRAIDKLLELHANPIEAAHHLRAGFRQRQAFFGHL